MEEITKIISCLGWPHITLIFGIFFIIIFYTPIIAFINRIKTVGKEGVTTDGSLGVQDKKTQKKAVEELMNIGDSVVRDYLEQTIMHDLSSRGLETEGDTIKLLVRYLAATQLALDYEQIYNLIFGSQILLLKRLNEVVGQGKPKEYIDEYFAKVQTTFTDLKTWSLDQYLDFLFKSTLITNVSGKYHITNKGVDFLSWMIRNGRTENRGL